MKQGKYYTTLILWIFLSAVVLYFGFYIFQAVYSPQTTATAILYEAGSGSYTSGYVVRSERLLRSGNDIATLLVSEGSRVAKDQIVATGYLNEDAQERQVQIVQLKQQLEELRYANTYTSDAADQAALDSEIQNRLIEMQRSVAKQDLNTAGERSVALKGLILRRTAPKEEEAIIAQRIEAISQELEAMESMGGGDTMTVNAPASGYFSGTVDGFETILTVNALDSLTVDGLNNLQPEESELSYIGKIITSDVWYYVTTAPAGQLQNLKLGDRVRVSFSALYESLPMRVERIGEAEHGSCVLVLSCDEKMQNVTLLRQQSADVIFSSYSGLRVPKEAIRVRDDNKTGVYVIEGNAAVWKTVKILYDNGESYVVELDKSSTGNLWPGDEILVGARDLYDGKVIR